MKDSFTFLMRPFRRKKDPKQGRSQETVESILEAVVQLVDSRDPESLTTNKIAEKAGVSIGSLYQYFPGKEAIFASLIEWYLRKEQEFILNALGNQKGDKPLDQSIDEMLSALIDLRRSNVKLEQTLMGFFVRTGDFEVFKNYDAKVLTELERALSEASTRGYVRAPKPGLTAFLLLHQIRSTFFAVTVERPELYEQPETLKQELRKVVLALIT